MTTLRESAGWLAVRLVENRRVMGEDVGDGLALELGDAVVDPHPTKPALRIISAPATVVSLHETRIRMGDRDVADREGE
jgi:hypothetical protein